MGQPLGRINLRRGLLEGSPIAFILFGKISNHLMVHLLARTQFVECQLVLPAANNCASLRLPPVARFDDWLLFWRR